MKIVAHDRAMVMPPSAGSSMDSGEATLFRDLLGPPVSLPVLSELQAITADIPAFDVVNDAFSASSEPWSGPVRISPETDAPLGPPPLGPSAPGMIDDPVNAVDFALIEVGAEHPPVTPRTATSGGVVGGPPLLPAPHTAPVLSASSDEVFDPAEPVRSLVDPRLATLGLHARSTDTTAGFAELGVFGLSRATVAQSAAAARPASTNPNTKGVAISRESFAPGRIVSPTMPDRRGIAASTGSRLTLATPSSNAAYLQSSSDAIGNPQPGAWRLAASIEEPPSSTRSRDRSGSPRRPDEPQDVRPEQIVLGRDPSGLRLIARAASLASVVAILRRAVGLARSEGVPLESVTVNGRVMTPQQIKERITPWP